MNCERGILDVVVMEVVGTDCPFPLMASTLAPSNHFRPFFRPTQVSFDDMSFFHSPHSTSKSPHIDEQLGGTPFRGRQAAHEAYSRRLQGLPCPQSQVRRRPRPALLAVSHATTHLRAHRIETRKVSVSSILGQVQEALIVRRYDRKRRLVSSGPPESASTTAAVGRQSAHPSASGDTGSLEHHADDGSVSYIVEVVHRPKSGSAEPVKVRYPIPASVVDLSTSNAAFAPPPVEDGASLQEALIYPAPDISKRLIRAFFEVIHAAYPVFDRSEFTKSYARGKASPLMLQTMFFLGFTVCGEQLVMDSGFSDRFVARRTHYRRAKALYDAHYEKTPTIVAGVYHGAFRLLVGGIR